MECTSDEDQIIWKQQISTSYAAKLAQWKT